MRFLTDLMAARTFLLALKILSLSRQALRSFEDSCERAVDSHGCSHASLAVIRASGSTVSNFVTRSLHKQAKQKGPKKRHRSLDEVSLSSLAVSVSNARTSHVFEANYELGRRRCRLQVQHIYKPSPW